MIVITAVYVCYIGPFLFDKQWILVSHVCEIQ